MEYIIILTEDTMIINQGDIFVVDKLIVIYEIRAISDNIKTPNYIDTNDLKSNQFYINNGFDISVWNLKPVDNGYIPRIKMLVLTKISIDSQY